MSHPLPRTLRVSIANPGIALLLSTCQPNTAGFLIKSPGNISKPFLRARGKASSRLHVAPLTHLGLSARQDLGKLLEKHRRQLAVAAGFEPIGAGFDQGAEPGIRGAE